MGSTVFPAAGGVTRKTDEFTSSGTWTCPAGVTSAEFLVVGAGGAGGGAGASNTTYYACGGGGGGGAVKLQTIPVTPGSVYTITVGAKGTGVSASAGGNGGFSEVLLSGTTLIRSYGGGGGRGISSANATISPTASSTRAGGGGEALTSTSNNNYSGGGGGAFAAPVYLATSTINLARFGVPEGSPGKQGSNGTGDSIATMGGIGINGFGNGGGGALSGTAAAYDADTQSFAFGAGAPVLRASAGATAGNNATIAGCGGSGAASFLSNTSVAGGNGADGLVRITYFA